jgi:hypothetical protein
MSPKQRTITFWATTILGCLPMFAGGIADLLHIEESVKVITGLGYPEYVLTILGVAKPLGVVIVLAPGLKRLKEWAYAGLIIDLVGASASHGFHSDGVKDVLVPIIIATILLASWHLRPNSRVLAPEAGPI